jgi:hypothetical protein
VTRLAEFLGTSSFRKRQDSLNNHFHAPGINAIQFFVSVSESHFAAFFFAIQLPGGLLAGIIVKPAPLAA